MPSATISKPWEQGLETAAGTGAGRGAPRRAPTLQSGEQGGKAMLAPWLVAPLLGT